jgi:hypothetical protein
MEKMKTLNAAAGSNPERWRAGGLRFRKLETERLRFLVFSDKLSKNGSVSLLNSPEGKLPDVWFLLLQRHGSAYQNGRPLATPIRSIKKGKPNPRLLGYYGLSRWVAIRARFD